MPAPTRRRLLRVQCTRTARRSWVVLSSLSKGASTAAAVRGSPAMCGTGSLVTRSDCNTTWTEPLTGEIS